MLSPRNHNVNTEMENHKISRNLPLDMITEVLFRLPMKTLLQLRCVSKQWYGLISSSSFKNLYDIHQRCRKPNKLLLPKLVIKRNSNKRWIRLQVIDLVMKTKNAQVYSDFRFEVPYRTLDLCYANSCHGLVYFASRWTKEIYVVNPSTKHVIELPEPPDGLTRNVLYGRRVSLGFLPSTNQYKVVCCYPIGDSIKIGLHDYYHEICFDIFTLTTPAQNWTKRVHPSFGYSLRMIQMTLDLSSSICIDGVMYWLITSGTSEPENSKVVLAFDLETEEAKIIPCPDGFSDTYIISLIEFRGCLCILVTQDLSGWWISAWMLKQTSDASDKWVQLFSNIKKLGAPVGYVTSQDVVLLNIESRKFQYLHVEMENNKVKSVHRLGDDSWEVYTLAVIQQLLFERPRKLLFSESFFSLN